MGTYGCNAPTAIMNTRVTFNCKRRGFCPGCGVRRIAESAALLKQMTSAYALVVAALAAAAFDFVGSTPDYENHTQLFTAAASQTVLRFSSLVSSGVRYPHLNNRS